MKKTTKRNPKEIYLQQTKGSKFWQDNPYTDPSCHFSSIQERIAEVKRYYSMLDPSVISQIPHTEAPANKASVSENRPLYTDFTSMIWIRTPDGYQHAIYHDAMISEHIDLPYYGKLHTHSFIEFMYVADGCFYLDISGKEYHFEAGDILLTDQNCEHMDIIKENTGTVVFMLLSADFLESILKSVESSDYLHRFLIQSLRIQRTEQNFLHFKPKGPHDGIDYVLEQMTYEDHASLPGKMEIIRWNLIRMFRILCAQYSVQLYSSNNQESKEKMILVQIERYIRFHLADVTVQDLEKEFHYHRNYYNILLKKYKNQSFREYVQTVRMELAASLLAETDFSIKQIAIQTGYENTSFFYRLFQKYFGKSPQEYKNALQQKNL